MTDKKDRYRLQKISWSEMYCTLPVEMKEKEVEENGMEVEGGPEE